MTDVETIEEMTATILSVADTMAESTKLVRIATEKSKALREVRKTLEIERRTHATLGYGDYSEGAEDAYAEAVRLIDSVLLIGVE